MQNTNPENTTYRSWKTTDQHTDHGKQHTNIPILENNISTYQSKKTYQPWKTIYQHTDPGNCHLGDGQYRIDSRQLTLVVFTTEFFEGVGNMFRIISLVQREVRVTTDGHDGAEQ